MKGDVRTLATVAKSGVSACSVAVVFSALVCVGGVLLAVITSVHGPDEIRLTNGAEARIFRSAGAVDIVYYAVGTVGYLAGVYVISVLYFFMIWGSTYGQRKRSFLHWVGCNPA
jgi:hypothetical protein